MCEWCQAKICPKVDFSQTVSDETGLLCGWPCLAVPKTQQQPIERLYLNFSTYVLNMCITELVNLNHRKKITIKTHSHHTCVRMKIARTIWTPLSRGCMRMASLKSWKRISGNCSKMLSNQNPANSGTFQRHKHGVNYILCITL